MKEEEFNDLVAKIETATGDSIDNKLKEALKDMNPRGHKRKRFN